MSQRDASAGDSIPQVMLKSGRQGSLRRRHPWVFRNAIERVEGECAPGGTVDVVDHEGTWLARGAWSPESQIAIRAWTFDSQQSVDEAFVAERIGRALARRDPMLSRDGASSAGVCGRVVFSESDGLPGVIVDRYDRWLVVHFLSSGAEARRGEVVDALHAALPGCVCYERSDADVRSKEGLEPRSGPLDGEEPPEQVEIDEEGCRYGVDLRRGHKTGFYLDQRVNRRIARELAEGGDVLNVFAYTGGFGVAALAGGASSLTQIETSAPALAAAGENLRRNGFANAQVEDIEGDAFKVLRTFRDSRRDFDLIVLDPPKFAESKMQVEKAARGYKDINLLGFKLLRPGGRLITFSCSGHMTPPLFQKIVADAALDAGRDAWIERRLDQAPDHPVALSFPEAGYLKGLVCRV